MSQAQKESPEWEVHDNQCGILLGYWDHEKTPTLIRELEYSVCRIEEKCKKLLEELIYYEKYLEESTEPCGHSFGFQSKTDLPNSECLCQGESDVVPRKNFINSHGTRKLFEEKFQQKLSGINKELTEVAEKMGLKNNIVLFPTNDYLKTLNAQIENEAEKSWSDIRNNFVEGYLLKPDPVFERGTEVEFSKITKNELDLYLKLSKMNTKRRKCKARGCQGASSKRRKTILSARRKMSKFRQDLRSSRFGYKSPKSGRLKLKKQRNKVSVPRRKRKCQSVCDSRATIPFGGKLKESEMEKIGKSSSESFGKTQKRVAEAGCGMSTGHLYLKIETRSGSRIQDVDSNTKRPLHLKPKPGAKASAAENVSGKPGLPNISFGGGKLMEKGRTNLRSPSDTEKETLKWGGHDPSKVLGDFRSSEELISPSFGKTQSMHSCSWLKDFPEGHESRTRRRIPTRKSPFKSLSNGPFQRADTFENGKDSSGFEKGSGDCSCKGGRAKLTKERTGCCSSFLRAYRLLKETLMNSDLTPADKELKSVQDEVNCSAERYEKFLLSYDEFLHSNHGQGPLKAVCEEIKEGLKRQKRTNWRPQSHLHCSEDSFQRS